MNERLWTAVTWLPPALIPAVMIGATIESTSATAPAIAWVPEVTASLLLGAVFFMGFLGALFAEDIDDSEGFQLPGYTWGMAGVALAGVIVNLAFIPLTDDSSTFVIWAVGMAVIFVGSAYMAARAR